MMIVLSQIEEVYMLTVLIAGPFYLLLTACVYLDRPCCFSSYHDGQKYQPPLNDSPKA